MKHTHVTDAELQAATRGDRKAIGHLYEVYQPRVLEWAEFKGARREGAGYTSEDIAQDVFVVVLEKLNKFSGRPVRDFENWLFMVTRNKGADVANENARYELGFDPAEVLDKGEDDDDQ